MTTQINDAFKYACKLIRTGQASELMALDYAIAHYSLSSDDSVVLANLLGDLSAYGV